MPSSAARRASATAFSGSHQNLRDRSHTAPGLRKDTRSSSSALSLYGNELAHFVGIVDDEDLHAEFERVANIDVALDRVGVNAAIWIDAEALHELHFAGRRQIHERAFGIHGAHDCRVRQRLECVVKIHAGQRLLELAELHAYALAVHDEQRRTELLHQSADFRGLERIDETGAAADLLAHGHFNFPGPQNDNGSGPWGRA